MITIKVISRDKENNRTVSSIENIYTEQEAIDNKIHYVHWRETSVGEYGKTDNGYVLKCLRRKDIPYNYVPGGFSIYRKFGNIYVWNTSKDFIYYPYGSRDKSKSKNMLRFKSIIQKKLMAKMIAAAIVTGEIDYSAIYKWFYGKPGSKEKGKTLTTRMLGNTEFNKELDMEIEVLCINKGLTRDYVVDKLKRSIDLAEEKDDPGAMQKGIALAIPLLGLNTKRSLEITTPYSISGIKVSNELLEEQTKKIEEIDGN